MTIKSVLKPENSIVAGLAVVGLVAGTYQLDAGSASQVSASDAYDPINSNSIKKAGATSLVLVTGISLIARDANIAILGFATIVLLQCHYRHSNAVSPATGGMVAPAPTSWQPALSAVPVSQQGQPVAVSA